MEGLGQADNRHRCFSGLIAGGRLHPPHHPGHQRQIAVKFQIFLDIHTIGKTHIPINRHANQQHTKRTLPLSHRDCGVLPLFPQPHGQQQRQQVEHPGGVDHQVVHFSLGQNIGQIHSQRQQENQSRAQQLFLPAPFFAQEENTQGRAVNGEKHRGSAPNQNGGVAGIGVPQPGEPVPVGTDDQRSHVLQVKTGQLIQRIIVA